LPRSIIFKSGRRYENSAKILRSRGRESVHQSAQTDRGKLGGGEPKRAPELGTKGVRQNRKKKIKEQTSYRVKKQRERHDVLSGCMRLDNRESPIWGMGHYKSRERSLTRSPLGSHLSLWTGNAFLNSGSGWGEVSVAKNENRNRGKGKKKEAVTHSAR